MTDPNAFHSSCPPISNTRVSLYAGRLWQDEELDALVRLRRMPKWPTP